MYDILIGKNRKNFIVKGSFMKIVKVTSKFQTTIPAEVRDELKLKIGDSVIFEIIDGVVVLKKIDSLDKAYLKAVAQTLSEWDSQEDEKAYHDLQKL